MEGGLINDFNVKVGGHYIGLYRKVCAKIYVKSRYLSVHFDVHPSI